MASVTRSNLAETHRLGDTAHALAEQATVLREYVGRFRVADEAPAVDADPTVGPLDPAGPWAAGPPDHIGARRPPRRGRTRTPDRQPARRGRGSASSSSAPSSSRASSSSR